MSQRYLGGVVTASPTLPTLASASGVWTLEQQLQNYTTWSPQQISRSVRLRSSASAYFNLTFGTPTNNKIWTYSLWVKRGKLGAEQELLNANSVNAQFYFSSSDTLNFYDGVSGATYNSTQVFRDPSAWYHIVVSVDTTQVASGNRVRVYVNGSQITAFSTGTAPTQNNASAFNVASTVHVIGRYNPTTINYFDGYLTEVNFIDGQALTPSSFGAFDSNGIWQPLPYTGTYGTNGFYLNFSDNSAATAAAIGKDYSGNGNNWTPNNISVTAGVTYDSMIDVPTNFADGGTGRGNYAVMNSLDKAGSGATSDANLAYSTSTSTFDPCRATIAVSSGKWYWEVNCVSQAGASGSTYMVGICNPATNLTSSFYLGIDATSYGYYAKTGEKYTNGVNTAYGATYTATDIIGVALDLDAGTIAFYKNGTSQGTAYSGLSGAFSPAYSDAATAGSTNIAANFGQRPFTYTPPTGFKALNTQNLPSSTIAKGNTVMDATLYTGNGSTQSIVNAGAFKPDLVWIKRRNITANNQLYDSVRGVQKALYSDLTNAETTQTGGVTAFNSSGFAVGSDAGVNSSGDSQVGWQWKAGGTAVSNTSGSITSQVSANTTAGFSVVTYTGTGANATVGHGLGVAPKFIIVRNRSDGTVNWRVYHASIGATNYLSLNLTNASAAASSVWNNTAPTSTVFSIANDGGSNGSSQNMVAYCWSEVAGYSKFGSYTGNGSADGPFVYCGFRPKFVMIKRTDTTANWRILDTTRDTTNVEQYELYPNLSNAEGTFASLDGLSNGFKIRNSDPAYNSSGGTYIFAAFAENPFSIARAR